MGYKLTERQVEIIRESLEKYWYRCKDNGDYDVMEEINALDNSLVEQKKEMSKEYGEMLDTISMCYSELTDTEPSEDKLQELADGLPVEIQADGALWGWDDTEVRDRVYGWVKYILKQG